MFSTEKIIKKLLRRPFPQAVEKYVENSAKKL